MLRPALPAVLLISLCSLAGFAQTGHRLEPRSPREGPNEFDQMDKQGKTPPPGQSEAARIAARHARIDQLNQDLPQLVTLAESLRSRLASTDLDQSRPADLDKQAEQLEKIARQIRKRVHDL